MGERINIQNLIDLFAAKNGLTKKEAENFLKEMFALIEQALESDKYVKIKGFGTFKLIEVDSRESVNVNTGERIEIQGHTKVSFTPDAGIRDQINKPFSHFETVILNEGVVFDDVNTGEEEADGDNDSVAVSEEMAVMPSPDAISVEPPIAAVSTEPADAKIEAVEEAIAAVATAEETLSAEAPEEALSLDSAIKTEKEGSEAAVSTATEEEQSTPALAEAPSQELSIKIGAALSDAKAVWSNEEPTVSGATAEVVATDATINHESSVTDSVTSETEKAHTEAVQAETDSQDSSLKIATVLSDAKAVLASEDVPAVQAPVGAKSVELKPIEPQAPVIEKSVPAYPEKVSVTAGPAYTYEKVTVSSSVPVSGLGNNAPAEPKNALPPQTATETVVEQEIKIPKVRNYTMYYFVGMITFLLLFVGAIFTFIYNPEFVMSLLPDATAENKTDSVQVIPATVKKDTISMKDSIPVTVRKELDKEASNVAEETAVSNEPTPVKETLDNGKLKEQKSIKLNPNDYKIVGTKGKYTVQEGESLVKISKLFYQSKDLWTLIVEHNPKAIKNPDCVPAGTVIRIPDLQLKK